MQKNGHGEDKQNTNAEAKDGIYAKLTVLSQESSINGVCPDPEELAAFSEGRLRGASRKKIMAHLNDCASCRRHWQMVQSTLEEMNIREATWTEKIVGKLKSMKERWVFVGGGVSLVLATCLLLIFLVPKQNELSRMINQSYVRLSPSDVARYNSFGSRGVEDSGTSIPPAYKAGLAAGEDRLLSNKSKIREQRDFENNVDILLYSMGQWSVVLQCACISHGQGSDDFWSAQEEIAAEIQNELKNTTNAQFEVGQIIESLAIIQNAAKQIFETGGTADGCEEIVFALENIQNHLRLKTPKSHR